MPISLFVKPSPMQRMHAAKCCQNVTQRDESRNTTLRQILFFKCATTVKHWFRLWLRAC
jgi:hypothetical protein